MLERKEVEKMVYTDLRARYLSNLITNEVLIESLKLEESGVDAAERRRNTNQLEAQNLILEAQLKLVEGKLKEIEDGEKLQENKRAESVGEKPKSNKTGQVRRTQK